MTIAFFSNFLNIHQLPFCEELIKHVGVENFRFVATTGMDPDRVQMGFEDMNKTKPFVVRAYEGGESYEEAKRLALESDVAIMGSAPLEFTKIRVKVNRLTFQYTERLLKLGWKVFLHPGFFRLYFSKYFKYRKKNMYVLCASAYTAPDLQHLGFPREKCFKWGYFPEVRPYNSFSELETLKNGLKHPGVSILWAGRHIGLKHPEVALYVAKRLKEVGVEYSMNIIGDGFMRTLLEREIEDCGLSYNVRLLGAQSHDVVLEEMEKADVFLFTSDRNEGWGAVLNEAMNAGCAVIASDAIGSAPFLVKNGVNGFLYPDGKVEHIVDTVLYLLGHKDKMRQVSVNAHQTIKELWSIGNATKELMGLINGFVNKKVTPVQEGPCSRA